MRTKKFCVMLVLGTMLTSCTTDWWEQKKYGNDLTLDDIRVKGTTAYITLPSGKVQELTLDVIRAAKDTLALADTIWTSVRDIRVGEVPCSGYELVFLEQKEKKGNLRISDALGQTRMTFGGYHIPIAFWSNALSVIDNNGQELVRMPKFTYKADVSLLTVENTPSPYVVAYYRLILEAFEEEISAGKINIVLKTTVKNDAL